MVMLVQRSQTRPRPAAPTPRTRPLGPIGFLRTLRENPIETFHSDCYERDIVLVSTILGRIALINDPAAIRHVLLENKEAYVRDAFQARMLSYLVGRSLITAEGNDWRRQRRELAPLFAPHRVSGFEPAIVGAAGDTARRIASFGEGAVIDAAREMGRASIGVLDRTIFRGGIDADHGEVAANLDGLFDSIGRLDLADALGLPRWVPRLGALAARRPQRFFVDLCERTLASARSRASAGGSEADLVATLLAAPVGSEGPGFSEDELRANLLLFLFAGFESTAKALTWSLYLLAIDPEWRERAEAETDREMPDGLFPAGGTARFPTIRAVIEEAMRLYPPVASIHRQAVREDRLCGVEIAPGTLVCVSTWLLHRHRTHWQDPDVFDPGRFMPGAREGIDRYTYLPFGLGPRTCIGASFAMSESVILLATLLRSLRFDMLPGETVEPLHRVTLRPRSCLPLRVSRR